MQSQFISNGRADHSVVGRIVFFPSSPSLFIYWEREMGNKMSADESLKDVVLIKYISNKQLLLSNSDISVKNIGRVIYLSTFTDGNNRLITDNNQLMSRQFMSHITGLSDKAFREFLKEIKDCGVLIEDKESKCFCLSDKYFVKRAILKKEKGMRYAFVSKCAVRHLYNLLGTYNHNVLSYLFFLVPFAHLQNNVICRNIESELNHLETLKLTEIARIIAVADSYDAMTSKRCYRDALPQEVVRNEIVKGRGTQFDPHIADLMLELIDNDVNYDLRQK